MSQMNQSRSCWHESATRTSIVSAPLPALEAGMVRVQALYSLISTGTERLVARGQVPTEVTHQMQVPYMGGNFPFPIKYGYSLVGKITSEEHPYHNRLVHLLHPHQDVCQVASQDIFLIPEEVSAKRAILASNLETAVNAVWDSGVSIGDKVLVVGFGVIGSLVARVLSMIGGVEVVVQELDLRRRNLAEQLGFWTQIQGTENVLMDCAFHTSSTAKGLQSAIDQVGFEGKVIELSWYGTQSASLELGGTFHSQRKQLISSQVSQLPADRKGRWNYRRRKEVVFELLKSPIFDQHLTHEIPFDQLPEVFDQIRLGTNKELSWVVRY
ncbi:MAG: zinc-binding alcohol dehydrogenase [Bacteroidota bacterium]